LSGLFNQNTDVKDDFVRHIIMLAANLKIKHMKTNLLLLILLLGFTIEGVNQTMLTRRQVYDFNVNDEFHFKNFSMPTPNAKRLKVISKQFSSLNDTVFYSFHYDNYTSIPVMVPTPHLEYQFLTGTNSVYYTDLDTLMNTQFQNFPIIDSTDFFSDTLYFSSHSCGRLIYQYNGVTHSGFEPTYRSGQFGAGLGEIIYYYYNTVTPVLEIDNRMFYYKKDTITCGTPDVLDSATVAAVYEIDNYSTSILLYPNPASTSIFIDTRSNESFNISIYNAAGIIVRRYENAKRVQTIDISSLSKGFYFATIESDKQLYHKKIIIE